MSFWRRSSRIKSPRMSMAWLGFACLLILRAPLPVMRAQGSGHALSDSEVEKLRDVAADYNQRVMVFTGFLDQRTKDILKLNQGKRHAGREEDIHDLMDQFAAIAEDLEDNLDDYAPRHRDLRKALPKLLEATGRWRTALQAPPDDERYSVSRKLALDAAADLHEDAARLIAEQAAWFKAHPANAGPKPSGAG